mgnify:CR=1 FL=1
MGALKCRAAPLVGAWQRIERQLALRVALRVLACEAVVRLGVLHGLPSDEAEALVREGTEIARRFGDVRMLAEDTGLMNPVAKVLWRIFRIDGPASRYRSEPARQAVVPVA